MCSVLDVTSNEILEGTDGIGSRSNPSEYELVTKDSDNGRVLTQFLGLEWRKECRAKFSGISRYCRRYREMKG